MKFLGLTVDNNGIRFGGLRADTTAVAKASNDLVTQIPEAAVGIGGGAWGSGSKASFWGVIRESFAGAWQRNITLDATENLLAFSSVYACLDLISKDISKLRPMLVELKDGIWPETTNPAYSPVLRKPNNYQTRIQFFRVWILSKLIHGNTAVLKERDQRGVVVALHVLNWRLVKVLVSDSGDVFYSITGQKLAGIDSITVPASEIMHDRTAEFFHPLIGVPPIFGCAMTVSQANRIQNNSSKFFENMSRPSGMLTTTETISDETAERLKATFEANFSGSNLGRLLIAGDGLKYEPMTIPAQQAQLIEQLKWAVQDVAACFHMPLYKLAGDTGVKYANMAEMNQDYYNQTLHALIEDIELLLDEGLGLAGAGNQTLGVMFDLEALFRLDPSARATRNNTAVKGGYWSPNEARKTDNLPPVKGGEFPYMQQQNFPLPELDKQPAPGSVPAAPSLPAPAVDDAQAAADAAAADAAKKAIVTEIAEAGRVSAEIMAKAAKDAIEQLAQRAARDEEARIAREAAENEARQARELVEREQREAARLEMLETIGVAQRSAQAAAEEREQRERELTERLAAESRAASEFEKKQISDERLALSQEREQLRRETEAGAEQLRAQKAAQELEDDAEPEELMAALVAKFTEAAVGER